MSTQTFFGIVFTIDLGVLTPVSAEFYVTDADSFIHVLLNTVASVVAGVRQTHF